MLSEKEKSFSELIKMYKGRAKIYLTQKELAYLLGVSSRTVRDWEGEIRYPSPANLKKLIELFYHRQLFTHGQEQEEAEILWNKRRERETFITFPPFDEDWFRKLGHPNELTKASLASTQTNSFLSVKHNLPVQLTSFIGREREIIEVKRLVLDNRLVTLTGAGGVGKTRLALQAAAQLLDEFNDGVWFVEFASESNPQHLAQVVAKVLRIRQEPDRPLIATLTECIRSQQLLLLLDNCEHLIEASAKLADQLLRLCPAIRIVATSREVLNIEGELSWQVPSLVLPNLGHPLENENLVYNEAVKLFGERARSAEPTFSINSRNAIVVAQICHRLDGIPLAIELAAACIKGLTVEQILTRLSSRFQLLTRGSRVAPPRHQTLIATIEWSYLLLTKKEQHLLQRLAIFSGSWSLEAAEKVCSGEDLKSDQIPELLLKLVNKSLIVVQERNGIIRYSMLETVRQYSFEKLKEANQVEGFQQKHLEYYLELVEEAEPKFKNKELPVIRPIMEAEHNNLQEALRWAFFTGQLEAELRLAGALMWFWWHVGNLLEAREWLEKGLLKVTSAISPIVQAKALYGAGWLSAVHRDYDKTFEFNKRALALYQALGDENGKANILSTLAMVACFQEDYEKAETLARESVALFKKVGDKYGARHVLSMGYIFLGSGRYDEASRWYEESLAISKEIEIKEGEAWALYLLGNLAKIQGNYEKASRLLEESITISREQDGAEWTIAAALYSLGELELRYNEYNKARVLLEESLVLNKKMSSKLTVIYASILLGWTGLLQKDYSYALAVFKESLKLNEDLKEKLNLALLTMSLEGLASIALAQSQLGQALTLAQAVKQLDVGLISPLPAQPVSPVIKSEIEALHQQLHTLSLSQVKEKGPAMKLDQIMAYALGFELKSS